MALGLPEIDLRTGHEQTARLMLCRVLDDGLPPPEPSMWTHHEALLSRIAQLADYGVADHLIQHLNDTATGAEVARIIRAARARCGLSR